MSERIETAALRDFSVSLCRHSRRLLAGISAVWLFVFLPLHKIKVILKSFSSGSSIFLVLAVAFINKRQGKWKMLSRDTSA